MDIRGDNVEGYHSAEGGAVVEPTACLVVVVVVVVKV
jgi:hypothetical protein